MWALRKNAAVTPKLRKLRFLKKSIDYLGYDMPPRLLQIASHTMLFADCRHPPTLQSPWSFLGRCPVFRRFFSNSVSLAAPMNKKLQNDQPTTFGPLNDEESQSMNALGRALDLPPKLALPKSIFHKTVDTDVCALHGGWELLQEQWNGSTKLIGYSSTSWTNTEFKNDTTHRRCKAIVWAVMITLSYPEETEFTKKTDLD